MEPLCVPLCPHRVEGVPRLQRARGASATGPRRLGGEERPAPGFQGVLATGAQPGGAGRPAQETGTSAWRLGSPARKQSGLRRPFPPEEALEPPSLRAGRALRQLPPQHGCAQSLQSSSLQPRRRQPTRLLCPGFCSLSPQRGCLGRSLTKPAQPGGVRLRPPFGLQLLGLSGEAGSGWVPPSLGCRQKTLPGAIPRQAPSSAGCRGGGEWAPSQAWAPGRGRLPTPGGTRRGKQVMPCPAEQCWCGFRRHLELRICRWSVMRHLSQAEATACNPMDGSRPGCNARGLAGQLSACHPQALPPSEALAG